MSKSILTASELNNEMEENNMDKLEVLRGKIEEILMDNSAALWQTVESLQSLNGDLDELDYRYNDDDFFNTHFGDDKMEMVRAICYGEYDIKDDYVKFDGNGNLESHSEDEVTDEMQGMMEEILNQLLDNYYKLDLDGDIDELIAAYESEVE